jgi:aminoglycoside phosphotransferase (APT) family kinase protein
MPLGLKDERETLSLIPGESGAAAWAKVVPETGLRAFARFLREYHTATEGFALEVGSRWAFEEGPPRPGQVICHGDPGPWNVVWRDGDPVGLVDFDFASPGDPLLDVAYALRYVAPFCDDEEALKWRSYPAPPDRRRRIAVFANGYGLRDTAELVGAVIARQQLDIERVRDLAEHGVEPQRTWVQDGMLDELAEQLRWSKQHRSLFE